MIEEESTISKRIIEFGKARGAIINNKLLRKVIENEGNCLCTSEPMKCPCGAAKFDIEDDGHCHCRLFFKENLK